MKKQTLETSKEWKNSNRKINKLILTEYSDNGQIKKVTKIGF